jgi:hypothetical protein
MHMMECHAVPSAVYRGGSTARTNAPLFLIDMRINLFWRFLRWLPRVLAMRPMLLKLCSIPGGP